MTERQLFLANSKMLHVSVIGASDGLEELLLMASLYK